MKHIDLARIDLNLLVTFEVLMRLRSVTGAAAELGRTQSAVSHALARLREQLGDPLLIKAGGRMTPTPYAVRLIADIVPILRSIQHVIAPPEAFEPKTSTRTFRIAFPVHSQAILTRIFARVQREAPGVRVEWLLPGPDMLPLVAGGQVDICEMVGDAALPEGIEAHEAQPFSWMTFMRRTHPAAADWGIEAWERWPHLQVLVDNKAPSPVDDVARAGRAKRRITALLPTFTEVAPLLAASDYLATMPPIIMPGLIAQHDLVARMPPVEIAPMRLRILWGRRLSNDPASRWFRAVVTETFAEMHRQAETELTARWLDGVIGRSATGAPPFPG